MYSSQDIFYLDQGGLDLSNIQHVQKRREIPTKY
jgi:hypothetical protein